MFTTIAGTSSSSEQPPPPPQSRKKRSQVARACDSCRMHRTKCDNHRPCFSCRTRGTQCSNNDTIEISTITHAHREIGRLKQKILELEQELDQERGKKAQSDSQLLTPPCDSPCQCSQVGSVESNPEAVKKSNWEGINIRVARSPHKTWYGPSSLFYFIRRFTHFLLEQNLSSDHVILDSASKLLDQPGAISEEAPGSRLTLPVYDPVTAGRYLSPTQEEYFLNLFWESYHTSLFPILNEAEFKEHYRSLWMTSGNGRNPSALVDIVIAMCMQYGVSMLPTSKQSTILDENDATIAGRWHYRRSQMLLTYESESPTISTLQCHLLSLVYLCCGSFQNMADSACALAVRVAYMLGIHLNPPQDMPSREREHRKRLWWALYVLDSKIGMKLGRPFLLRDSDPTPSLPSDDLEAAKISGSNFAPLGDNVTWLSFHLQNAKLFLTARTAHSAFYEAGPRIGAGQTLWDSLQNLEVYAAHLLPYTKRLEEWVNSVPSALKTKRQNNGFPFSTDCSALEIEQFAPLWLQRQRLVLELMYHNLCINLNRPFISFVPIPATTPGVEKPTICCVSHSIALTQIMDQVLSTTSILNGWHEAFQWQWNAAMSLVGFVLAYPQNTTTPAARGAIDLSVAIFDMFGGYFPVAISAANIVRDLRTKVDFLIERNGEKQSISEISQLAGETTPLSGLTSISEKPDFMDTDSTLAGAVDGALTADGIPGVMNQDIFDMALAIDLWGNLDTLFPNAGSNTLQY